MLYIIVLGLGALEHSEGFIIHFIQGKFCFKTMVLLPQFASEDEY